MGPGPDAVSLWHGCAGADIYLTANPDTPGYKYATAHGNRFGSHR